MEKKNKRIEDLKWKLEGVKWKAKRIQQQIHTKVSNAMIKKFAYGADLFVLSIVSPHKVTEDDLRIAFASYHARFPERPYESFLKSRRNWDGDKYTFDIEPQGYFLDEATAIDYVKRNIGDIYECGSFPYAIVSSMPLNRAYPTCNSRKHRLFHYNRETDRYEEIDWDYNEVTQYLHKRGEGGAF